MGPDQHRGAVVRRRRPAKQPFVAGVARRSPHQPVQPILGERCRQLGAGYGIGNAVGQEQKPVSFLQCAAFHMDDITKARPAVRRAFTAQADFLLRHAHTARQIVFSRRVAEAAFSAGSLRKGVVQRHRQSGAFSTQQQQRAVPDAGGRKCPIGPNQQKGKGCSRPPAALYG